MVLDEITDEAEAAANVAPWQDPFAAEIAALAARLKDPKSTDGTRASVAARVAALAIDAENGEALVASGVAPSLVASLKFDPDACKAESCGALAALCYSERGVAAAIACGAVPALVAAVGSRSRAVASGAAFALASMSGTCDAGRGAVGRAGALAPLVALVAAPGGDEDADRGRECGARALWNLGRDADLRSPIASAGAIGPLVGVSRESLDPETQSDAAFWAEAALSSLSHEHAKNAGKVKAARERVKGGTDAGAAAVADAAAAPKLGRANAARDLGAPHAPRSVRDHDRRGGLDATTNVAARGGGGCAAGRG